MKLDILAFGAHPDDVELFAGGTLAKAAAAGYAAGVVDMTRGELGTRGTPRRRAAEATEAARLLGLRVRENLGFPDGSVFVSPPARLRVVRVIRKYRPEVVLVHYWEDRHPDHVYTSTLVTEAAHHAGLGKIRTGQERHRPNLILYYKLPSHVAPTVVVDISPFASRKRQAIEAHRSQLFSTSSGEPETYLSRPDFLERVDAVHAHYGALIGKSRAEGFFVRGAVEIHDVVEFARSSSPLRRL